MRMMFRRLSFPLSLAMATIACSDATHEDRGPDNGDSTSSAVSSCTTPSVTSPETYLHNVVPAPLSVTAHSGQNHTITSQTVIGVDAASPQARQVGEYLASLLRPATGFALPLKSATAPLNAGITLLLSGADSRWARRGISSTWTLGIS